MLALLLFFVSLFLPVPRGTWYFGRHPQWIVAVDSAGLTLGPTSQAQIVLSFVPLVAAELFVFGTFLWLIRRLIGAMLRVGHPAAR